MLIILSDSIGDIDPSNENHLRALETILSAYHYRNHVIFVEQRICRKIIERTSGILGSTSISTLKILQNKIIEYRGLLNTINHKIFVHLDQATTDQFLKNKAEWHIPLNFFATRALINAAIIGENPNDAIAITILAEHYMAKYEIKGFFSNGRKMNGGGSGTPVVLTNYLEDEASPCLCITDSDRFHPKFKESDTVSKCKDIASRNYHRIVKFQQLNERELENLLPVKFLKEINEGKRFISEFENLALTDYEQWKYVDVKNGISREWINRQDSDTQKYWEKANKSLTSRNKACNLCKNDTHRKNDCGCNMVRGMGNSTLWNSIKHLTDNPKHLNLRLLDEDLRWEEIAKLAYEFTLAPQSERHRLA